jgi:hypothetical protein
LFSYGNLTETGRLHEISYSEYSSTEYGSPENLQSA